MDLDKPDGREGKLDNNTDEIREHNIHTTSPLHYKNDSNRHSPELERTIRQIDTNYNQQSPLQGSSGTTKQISFTSPNPNPEQLSRVVHSPHEYLITENTQNIDNEFINSVIDSLSNNNDNNSIRERKQQLHSDRNKHYTGDNRDNFNINKNEHPTKSKPDQSSMEIRINRSPNAHSYRSRTSSPAPSSEQDSCTETEDESPRSKRKRTETQTPDGYMGERTPTNLRRRLFNTEPESTDRSADPGRNSKYYTFTITKCNTRRLPTNSNQCPAFIRFDHKDHWHILYTATTESNAHRQLRRICKYLHALPAGFTESAASKQCVRHIWKFVDYCSRYGLGSVSRFGYKVDSKITDIINKLSSLPLPEITQNTEPCRQYAEQQKEKFEKNRQFKNITHTITDIITKNNIESQTDWDLKIDLQTKMQLMAEFGLRVGNYVQTILRINRAEKTKQIKLKTFLTVYEEIIQQNPITESDMIGIDWIIKLFETNNINLIEFFAWHEIIKTHRYTKINTIIFHGPTNAGKSMLLDLLIKPLHPEEIPRERDNSSFHLDQLPAATVATFEEPLITPSNVGTWKLLMEGKPIKTDIKHKDKERINRIPIWITTASPIDNNVDGNEKAQLKQRYKCFQFKNQIEHNITENKYTPIQKCPIFLQTKHIAALYIANYDNIFQYIQQLDNRHTLSDDLLPIATTCTHQLNERLQTRLTLPARSLEEDVQGETPVLPQELVQQ